MPLILKRRLFVCIGLGHEPTVVRATHIQRLFLKGRAPESWGGWSVHPGSVSTKTTLMSAFYENCCPVTKREGLARAR